MPSTATITAFYSFTANTKARASQVNGNFDVFRGHFIPIDPNTQTANNLGYDLGSTEYYWRTAHVGGYTITNETTTGLGGLKFSLGGTEKFRIASSMGETTTAGVGGYAFRGIDYSSTGVSNTTTGQLIPGSTLTVTTIGRPVTIGFTNATTTASWLFTLTRLSSNGAFNGTLFVYVDNVKAAAFLLGGSELVAGEELYIAPLSFVKSVAAGTHTVDFRFYLGSNQKVSMFGTAFYAIEA